MTLTSTEILLHRQAFAILFDMEGFLSSRSTMDTLDSFFGLVAEITGLHSDMAQERIHVAIIRRVLEFVHSIDEVAVAFVKCRGCNVDVDHELFIRGAHAGEETLASLEAASKIEHIIGEEKSVPTNRDAPRRLAWESTEDNVQSRNYRLNVVGAELKISSNIAWALA